MSVALAETSTNTTPPAGRFDLWCGIEIPYIRGSGETESGKTMFGLSIDPNCRNFDVAPTTVVWDFEGSADPYKSGLNFDHRDLSEIVRLHVGTSRRYKPIDLYYAWNQDVKSLGPANYRVGMVDTFSDVESGLIEWVRQNPKEFGRTANEYIKAASMFLWPDVKAFAKQLIFGDLRPIFQTFYTTHHLKNSWDGGKKTGDRIAEGLDVLEKLASLHLRFDRRPTAKNKSAPEKPSAIRGKARLIQFGKTPEEDRSILPPRLPVATPQAIREYIKNPPDFNNLKKEEQLPDQSLTDDQKLLINQDIAFTNMEAAKAHQQQAELMNSAAQLAGVDVSSSYSAIADAQQLISNQLAKLVDPAELLGQLQSQANAEEPTKPVAPVTEQQLAQMKQLMPAAFGGDVKAFVQHCITAYSVNSPKLLSSFQAGDLIKNMTKQIASDAELLKSLDADPANDTHMPANTELSNWAKKFREERAVMLLERAGMSTKEQQDRIKKIIFELYTDDDRVDVLKTILGNYQKATFLAFTVDQANDVIEGLLKIQFGYSQELPGVTAA